MTSIAVGRLDRDQFLDFFIQAIHDIKDHEKLEVKGVIESQGLNGRAFQLFEEKELVEMGLKRGHVRIVKQKIQEPIDQSAQVELRANNASRMQAPYVVATAHSASIVPAAPTVDKALALSAAAFFPLSKSDFSSRKDFKKVQELVSKITEARPTDLDMRGEDIGQTSGLKAIFNVMKLIQTVKKLDLSDQGTLGDEGAEVVAYFLKRTRRQDPLEHLDLSQTQIHDKGGEQLLEALRRDPPLPVIKYIDLKRDWLSVDMCGKLERAAEELGAKRGAPLQINLNENSGGRKTKRSRGSQ